MLVRIQLWVLYRDSYCKSTFYNSYFYFSQNKLSIKDNFSDRSNLYAQFRPTYPPELADFLTALAPARNSAWDCGCGNGQMASLLAGRFERVDASDISQSQLDNAVQKENIRYALYPAETTGYPANTFDLIVAAQAAHWFDFNAFYAEARRTAREGAMLALVGYGVIQISAEIDSIIDFYYKNVVGSYWDAERALIDAHYQTLPFPFEEIPSPDFSMHFTWPRAALEGYLNTWSSVRHYIRKNNRNPVDDLMQKIPDQPAYNVSFPIFARVGRL